MLIGSHVSMSGKAMLEGAVKESLSYGANTFMIYTGAPQNTRRKPIEEMKIAEGKALMAANGIDEFIVHAPYIINLEIRLSLKILALQLNFYVQKSCVPKH